MFVLYLTLSCRCEYDLMVSDIVELLPFYIVNIIRNNYKDIIRHDEFKVTVLISVFSNEL